MGGTTGATQFTAMDMDAAGNIIVGGSTYDLDVLKTPISPPDPFLMYIQHGNFYLWGFNVIGENYNRIGQVKFNANGSLIFAGYEQRVSLNYALTFSVF